MARIVITGGNRGIGLELARLYDAAGDEVHLGVRQPDVITGKAIVTSFLDVVDDRSVAEFAARMEDRPVDLLINNAGIMGPDRQSTLDMDFAGFLDSFDTNTLGPLRVTQALLPNLRKAKEAKVAVLTSRMGSLGYAKSDHVAYRASKAAANKVTQCLATDLVSENIAVVALHPGWVRTDMGGPSAEVAPEESARGLKKVLDGLSIHNSGSFLDFEGNPVDW